MIGKRRSKKNEKIKDREKEKRMKVSISKSNKQVEEIHQQSRVLRKFAF